MQPGEVRRNVPQITVILLDNSNFGLYKPDTLFEVGSFPVVILSGETHMRDKRYQYKLNLLRKPRLWNTNDQDPPGYSPGCSRHSKCHRGEQRGAQGPESDLLNPRARAPGQQLVLLSVPKAPGCQSQAAASIPRGCPGPYRLPMDLCHTPWKTLLLS